MKTFAVAAMATMVAGSVAAADLGYGFTLGGEIDGNYTTGTELFAVDLTTGVGYAAYGVDFSIDTTFDVLSLNDGDVFEGLDFGAEYAVGATGITAYGEVSTDADLEFGDLTVGAKLAF
jgi:hypothetical protein